MAESNKCSTECSATNINPPILMKVETQLNDAGGKDFAIADHARDKEIGDIKMCSPSFQSSSDCSKKAAVVFQSKNFQGILKPPLLSLSNNTTSNYNSNPDSLNSVPEVTNTTSNEKSIKTCILNPSRLIVEPLNKADANYNDTRQCVQNGETLKFVPLIQADDKTRVVSGIHSSALSSTANNSFVFGQNLKDRVIAETSSDESKASTSMNSNGTSQMLFSTAIKHEVKLEKVSPSKETKTLSESAREYEESRAVKRKYEEVEIRTGEEEETNILNISCKLFAYNNTSGSWQERGRGTLRLNDFDVGDKLQSRLVFRTSGSLRVVLNTKIWAEMTVEKASDKSVRLTALDANGEVKVFLIMANVEDAKQLFNNLQGRLDNEVALQKHKKSSNMRNLGSGDE